MTDETTSNPRRNFLRQAIGMVPAAALIGGGAVSVAEAASTAAPASTAYQPTYFTPEEWAFINAAVDRLIPSNEDGPGGVELHVPEFIDRQMETTYGHGGLWYMSGPFQPDADPSLGYQLRFTPRELYRVAITDIDSWCAAQHGKKFHELPPETQDEVLGGLQKGSIALANVKAQEFFIQLLANTKEGYFADPMYGGNLHMGSWKMIGFPGARADYADWAQQPGKVYPLGPVSIQGEKA